MVSPTLPRLNVVRVSAIALFGLWLRAPSPPPGFQDHPSLNERSAEAEGPRHREPRTRTQDSDTRFQLVDLL